MIQKANKAASSVVVTAQEEAVKAEVLEARGVGARGGVGAEGDFDVEDAEGVFSEFKGWALLVGTTGEAEEFGDGEDGVALGEGLGAVGVGGGVGEDDAVRAGAEGGGFGTEFEEDLAGGLGGGGVEAGDAEAATFADSGSG
jgi:hypothetical protein